MSSRVTLTDIAEELGLSISTVSNAYNRPDQLSAATRQQVLATAKRLGYAGPDPRASSLRSGRAGAIGLIELSLPTALTDPASLLMLSGVAQACDEAGVALVLIPSSEERDTAHDIVRTAVVDGFVAHCDALDDERRAIVEDRRLPVVVLDGRARPDDPSVDIDEEAGAAAAADHLLELGHRRLAIVGFPPHGNTGSNLTTERRRAGYLSAIRAAGIDPGTVLQVEGSAYDRAETAVVARRILLRPDRPTAVLAMSDEMAVAVIDAAIGAGLRVPEDLSVVGFDDTAVARDRSLTTVHQPHAEKGAAAVRMLLEPNGDRRITFPVELVVRASTAAP